MAALALLSGSLSSRSSHWEKKALPKELNDAEVLVSSDQDGFREGSWSAVYRLSDNAARGITANGIGFFSKTGGEP